MVQPVHSQMLLAHSTFALVQPVVVLLAHLVSTSHTDQWPYGSKDQGYGHGNVLLLPMEYCLLDGMEHNNALVIFHHRMEQFPALVLAGTLALRVT
jgi:hypothetical protein